jgi:hypothetical protein
MDLIHLLVDKMVSLDGNSKTQVVTHYVRVYDKRREENLCLCIQSEEKMRMCK